MEVNSGGIYRAAKRDAFLCSKYFANKALHFDGLGFSSIQTQLFMVDLRGNTGHQRGLNAHFEGS